MWKTQLSLIMVSTCILQRKFYHTHFTALLMLIFWIKMDNLPWTIFLLNHCTVINMHDLYHNVSVINLCSNVSIIIKLRHGWSRSIALERRTKPIFKHFSDMICHKYTLIHCDHLPMTKLNIFQVLWSFEKVLALKLMDLLFCTGKELWVDGQIRVIDTRRCDCVIPTKDNIKDNV